MTDQWTDRLSEYLDDELSGAERQQIETHLADCLSCRQVLAEIHAVVARAGSLQDREPVDDLWPVVEGAINRQRVVALESRRRVARRISFSLPQVIGAAAALVLVSAGGAWFLSRSDSPGPSVAQLSAPAGLQMQPVTFDREGRADSAISELEHLLQEESGRLDSSTVRILIQSLAVIDRAIGQARKALDADPNNPYLNDHLARTMRKKIEVLRRAADLAQVAS